MKTERIGGWTVSFGLLGTGILVLLKLIGLVPSQVFQYVGPSLLIVLGIEIIRSFYFQSKSGQRATFGTGSVMLLVLVLAINLAQFMFPWQPVFSSPVNGQIQVNSTIKYVEIRIPDGKVSVTGTTQQVLTYTGQLTASGSSKSEADKVIAASWKVRTSGDRLVLLLEQPYTSRNFSLFDLFRPSSRSPYLNVQIPEALMTKVITSNGKIDVVDMKADADLNTSNGDITVQRIKGNIHAETSNGSLEMNEVEGSAHIVTNNGAITLTDIAGSVFARTSNGPIQATSVVNESWECDTSNGTIMMTLSGDPNVTIQAKTSNGNIGGDAKWQVDGKDRHSSTMGTGSHTMLLSTKNGKIQVFRAK